MKVSIVTATFPPYRGGMGSVAELHARLLARQGHEVTVVTAGSGVTRHDGGFTVRRLRPILRIGNGAFLPQVAPALRGADAVMLHYPAFGLLEGVLLWRKTVGRRKRFVVVYHMDPVAKGFRGAVFAAYGKTLGPALLRYADAIAVSSRDYAEHGSLATMGERVMGKLVELPLAVDIEAFSPGPCTTTDHGRFALAERNLLFVGGMDRSHDFKGVPILLQAFKKAAVPNLKLHLVGDGELRPRYEELTASLAIADRVAFHGSLSPEDLSRIYRCADLFVLPSTGASEAFGLVLLEAMASGVPTVASDLPGVRTVVREGETGWLVAPGDADDLAERIRVSFIDPRGLRTAGENARRRVESRYAPAAIAEGLADLL